MNDVHREPGRDDAGAAYAHPRQRLQRALRRREFCMLIQGLDRETAARHLEALREALQALQIDIDGCPLRITISLDACQRDAQFPNLHKLLGEADRHLYLAKAGGRNQLRGLEPG
ncbi:GGDEF domain-containing protein [Thermomonas alba]|uniref:GGDEF domain-containing protein n=1 Tax=Thermomonas alba TaxID=2888525 RepID=UPI0030B86299